MTTTKTEQKTAKPRKKMSAQRRIMRMLEKGLSPKEIASRVGCSLQTVYNARYRMNQKKGLGSLPASANAPRPRGRPRKNFPVISVDASDQKKIEVPAPAPIPVYPTYTPAKPIPTQPSLWQRVKERFTSVWR